MIINGPIDGFLERMLDVTAKRQEAISSNLANIDTPGYKAQDVDFQKELSLSIQFASNDPSNSTTPPVELIEIEGTMKSNGNNVDLERQMTGMTQNGLQYLMLSQALSSAVKSLRYSISEGAKG